MGQSPSVWGGGGCKIDKQCRNLTMWAVAWWINIRSFAAYWARGGSHSGNPESEHESKSPAENCERWLQSWNIKRSCDRWCVTPGMAPRLFFFFYLFFYRAGKAFTGQWTPKVATHAHGHSSYLWRSLMLCNKEGAGGPSGKSNVLLSAHPYRRVALHRYAIEVTALWVSDARSRRLLRAGWAPAAQVPLVNQARGEFEALLGEGQAAAAKEVSDSRAGLFVGREKASSLHFCCACVRSRGDVRSEFTPLSRHHHPGACPVLTNGRGRKAERRRPSGRLLVGLITQIFLPTVMHQAALRGLMDDDTVQIWGNWPKQKNRKQMV